MTTAEKIPAGTRLLFEEDGLSFATGAEDWKTPQGLASKRGMVIVVTDSLRRANEDRLGGCWIDLADDLDGQHERWGKKMFSVLADDAEVPPHLLRARPGSPEAQQEFDREHLRLISDRSLSEEDRARQLSALRKRLQPGSSQRSQGVRGDSGDPRLDAPRTGRERS